MTYNTPELYKYYVHHGGILSYPIFSTLIQEFNTMVMDEIILKGERFNMGHYLSTLSIGRLKRNFSNKQVNWHESNKLKRKLLSEGKKLYDADTGEGHKWLVYYTTDWYCRFYWNKGNCKVANKTVYRFTATRGEVGNKTKLKELLAEDDLAYLEFEELN